jgi:hypothetical protein
MKDLLLFARPTQPRPAPVDIGSLEKSTASLLTEDPALAGSASRSMARLRPSWLTPSA